LALNFDPPPKKEKQFFSLNFPNLCDNFVKKFVSERRKCQLQRDFVPGANDMSNRLIASGVVIKNEVGERLEIEVETVAKSAILQEFCIV